MVTVMLVGSDKDIELTNVLLEAIRAVNGSAMLLTAKSLIMQPSDAMQADFVVIDSISFTSIHMESGIVLFKQDISSMNPALKIPRNFIAITDSENCEAVEFLRKIGIQTVTCGLSSKDSVTFSSFTVESAVVGLQREIKTIDGSIIFPHEIPVTFKAPRGEYPVLAAVAVLLIAGRLEADELMI